MQLAKPAIPKGWRLERLRGGQASVVCQRPFSRTVWLLTPGGGLAVRRVVLGFTWGCVDYPEGNLVVECGEGFGWDLQLHRGAAVRSLYRSHDLDAVLGLAAFLEEELSWALRAPTSSPYLFRQLVEHALAKQDLERVRLLVQDARTIPILMRAWMDWAPAFRPRLCEVLRELELETGFLSQLATQVGSDAQAGAIELLGELEARHACPVLRQALETASGTVRPLAARVLGRLRDRDAVPALCAAVQYAPALRDVAVQALGEIGDPGALPTLLELLQSSGEVLEIRSRLMVIAALGRIKDPAAVPALEGVLRCGILELREGAIQALREIGGPHVISPLASVLADPDARIAVRAAGALEQLREPAARQALAGAWAKGHLEVRVRAVRALAETGDEPAVLELCRALSDSVYIVRHEAASGFIRLAGPGRKVPIQVRAALPILRQRLSLLTAERPEIRNACRNAIQRIEAATGQMKHLPLPAAGEELGPELLPLPADAAPGPSSPDQVEAPGVRR